MARQMDKVFYAQNHFLARALGDVKYPISKAQLLEEYGDKQIKVDFDAYKPLREFIDPIDADEFTCAAALHFAIIALL